MTGTHSDIVLAETAFQGQSAHRVRPFSARVLAVAVPSVTGWQRHVTVRRMPPPPPVCAGIVLTNDGNSILREIDVSHPAAKVQPRQYCTVQYGAIQYNVAVQYCLLQRLSTLGSCGAVLCDSLVHAIVSWLSALPA